MPVYMFGGLLLLIFTDALLPAHRFNFEPGSHLILAGTIQFASSIQLAKQQLASDYPSLVIPQSKPLSPGQHACTHSMQTGRIMPSLMQNSNPANLYLSVCVLPNTARSALAETTVPVMLANA